MLRKLFRILLPVTVVLFGAMQFVRPVRTNPPSDRAASFASVAKPPAEVAAIVDRACSDCHSNRTVWPWYSGVAPVSWVIAGHVKEGRARLNLSEWNRYGPEMSQIRQREMCEEVRSGDMPLWQHKLAHPESRLTDKDVALLCAAARQ
jgi:hypothetical protein